jgi:hypothetical protein
MSAAALPAGTDQLALVAAFCQRSNDARAAWLGTSTRARCCLMNSHRETPRSRGSPREQSIVLGIQRNRGRFLPRESHEEVIRLCEGCRDVGDRLNSYGAIGGFVDSRRASSPRHTSRRAVVLGQRHARFTNETDAVQLIVELDLCQKALPVT